MSKIETGKQLPTAADVKAWAAATGTDPSELLELLDRARIEYASFRERFAELAGADRLQDAIGAAETRRHPHRALRAHCSSRASSRPPTTPASCCTCPAAPPNPAPARKRSAA